MPADTLDRLRSIVLSLPEVSERLSHGATCFFFRERPVCYFHDRHNDDRVSLWCPAPPGSREILVASDPARYFTPPTSARGAFSTWIGVFLGVAEVDWEEIAAILDQAFRLVATRAAIAELDRNRA